MHNQNKIQCKTFKACAEIFKNGSNAKAIRNDYSRIYGTNKYILFIK